NGCEPGANRMRRLWSLFGSIRNSGGVIRNGVLTLSGVEWTSPVSIHASTSAGLSAALLSRTVTSPCLPGNTTRVPPITTLARAHGVHRQSAASTAQAVAMKCFMDDPPCAASNARFSGIPPRHRPQRNMGGRLLVDHRELDAGIHRAGRGRDRRGVILRRVVEGRAAGAEVHRRRV